MTGTIINSIAIIFGGLLGLLFKKGIPERYKTTVMQAVSLAVILIGLKGAIQTNNPLIVIIGLAIGSVIGEFINIEDKLDRLGKWMENWTSGEGGSFSEGFVTASLMYCVGSMAIIGSFESGLTGTHQTLFAKSTLDGIISVILASTLGMGVVFAALPVFLYQGVLTLAAGLIKPYLVATVIAEMTSIGGLLIAAIGINILGGLKMRIGNMLPAVFVPLVYYLFRLLIFGH